MISFSPTYKLFYKQVKILLMLLILESNKFEACFNRLMVWSMRKDFKWREERFSFRSVINDKLKHFEYFFFYSILTYPFVSRYENSSGSWHGIIVNYKQTNKHWSNILNEVNEVFCASSMLIIPPCSAISRRTDLDWPQMSDDLFPGSSSVASVIMLTVASQ